MPLKSVASEAGSEASKKGLDWCTVAAATLSRHISPIQLLSTVTIPQQYGLIFPGRSKVITVGRVFRASDVIRVTSAAELYKI